MDAVPVTLGQEFAGYAAQVRLGARARGRTRCRTSRRSRSAARRRAPGLNTHPEFAERVRARLAADTGLDMRAPEDPFEAQANRDALVELSGALKVVAVSLTKIANDLALMGSGPRAGIGELFLPELQKGSSIMPGKVNPVHARGRPAGLRAGDRQRHRDHDRRPAGPVRAQRAHPADRAQPAAVDRTCCRNAATLFAEKCVDGIEANLAGCEASAEGTLAVATALNPFIGYDKGGGDRQGRVGQRAHAARGRARARRRRGDARRGARPAQDRRGLDRGMSAGGTDADLRARIEAYNDAVMRPAADVEEHGPLVLFVSRIPWRFCARPRLGAQRPSARTTSPRCAPASAELGVPEAFEWVDETTPSMAGGVRRRRACG